MVIIVQLYISVFTGKECRLPELWIYDSPQLKIKILINGEYIDSNTSLTFPDIDVIQIIPQYMQRAKVVGVSQALDEEWH
jgi:hypothetical protein